MKKRFVSTAAAVIALLITFQAILLAGCAKSDTGDNGDTSAQTAAGGSQTTVPQTDSSADAETTAFAEDSIPDDLDYGGKTVTVLYWKEHTMKEFFAEEISGDLSGDAIIDRNIEVEKRLGVTLNFVAAAGGSVSSTTDFRTKATADVTSGAGELDIIADYSRTAPAMALEGLLCDLNSLEYIDFEQPWWPSSMIEQCMVDDQLYYCSGDISTNLLWMMVAPFFNKNLIESLSLEDPYELVKSNSWTLDKFIELTSNSYSDLDGGGVVDDGDFYGLSFYEINLDAFFNGAGFVAIEKDSADKLIASPNLTSQRTIDLLDKLGGYFNNSNDVTYSGSTSVRDIFFEQRSIFTVDRVFIVAGKDNYGEQIGEKIEFEYGIVPNPKYDSSQEDYLTNVGHPFTMYAVTVAAKDADMSSAVLECMGSESFRRVTPAVFEMAMKLKYASDDTASEMYDILRSTVCFDLGRFYSAQIGDLYKTMRTEVEKNTKTFSSNVKAQIKIVENGIKTISKQYEG